MKFNFEATGIGSLPFKDPKAACGIVFDNFKHIPFWPQLPKRSYLEHMYCQFSEGIPGLKLDEANKTLHIDTGKCALEMEKAYQKYLDDIASRRKTMVSTGDRSAKIRTYNYPQGRMTDHRIGLTVYNLPAIMDGDIEEIIDKLRVEEHTERLKETEL